MRNHLVSLLAFLFLAVVSCGKSVPTQGEDPSEQDNPLMRYPYLTLSQRRVEIGEDFDGVTLQLFSSRQWQADYDSTLICIEPDTGPGQIDTQQIRISLREGVRFDSYIPDAVFTCEDWSIKLPFKTVLRDYPLPQKGDTLTIMEFNIERGMASDKEYNFDNFVAWVKEIDPDVLLLCECNEFNDETFSRLAVRWGHGYSALTFADGWNPAISSKYPLSQVVRFTNGMSHGAVKAEILGIGFICLHACAGWHVDWYEGEQDYDGDGDTDDFDYRIAELHNIFDHTIFTDSGKDASWILTGDFNAVARSEKQWFYWGDKYWVEHDYIAGLGYWTDIMRAQHPDEALYTYGRNRNWNSGSAERLDYFYLSPNLVGKAADSRVIADEFTASHSDHRPIVLRMVY